MVNTYVKSKNKSGEYVPDIFRAASNNDPTELRAAIAAGQSLDMVENTLGMTPMHIACVHESNDFLEVAVDLEHDPWIRDDNLRLAFDHAAAHRLRDIGRRLLDRLYPKDARGIRIVPTFD